MRSIAFSCASTTLAYTGKQRHWWKGFTVRLVLSEQAPAMRPHGLRAKGDAPASKLTAKALNAGVLNMGRLNSLWPEN